MHLALNAQWRPRALIISHLLIALLFASWLWPVTRIYWNQFDLWLFHLLNDPVHAGGLWAHIWAIGSMRPVDAGVGLVMLAIMLRAGLVFPAAQVRTGLYAFLVALIVMLLMRVLFADLVEYMGWQHASPSLLVEGSARLTELFPAWEERWDLKDSASRSFPGDHASVLMIWAMFCSFFVSGWRRALVWTVAVIGMLPRLVAGAHWGADAFVGGVLLSVLGIAWSCYTPLAFRASAVIERLTSPLTRCLAKVPLLRSFSVIGGNHSTQSPEPPRR
ncbi:phosphatase PAP2 family protein [Phytopseudomonas daroniae]|uniref:phosphatase PAP2 family protein n=1 Tax=Phytopseudomonas daroniae TaxID=2487519 RepID=UPI0010384FA6|nr:phosphatase PAP2 family protein [Pseudomonas daroniae]TBU76281.1 phosphoesterase [Pseudomonas daroniae]